MAKNRTMAAKHALARKWACSVSVHNALGQSMEDVKSGAIARPVDGVDRYFRYNSYMQERSAL